MDNDKGGIETIRESERVKILDDSKQKEEAYTQKVSKLKQTEISQHSNNEDKNINFDASLDYKIVRNPYKSSEQYLQRSASPRFERSRETAGSEDDKCKELVSTYHESTYIINKRDSRLESDESKLDHKTYIGSPTENWDDWKTSSDGSSLLSEIERDFHTNSIKLSDSFDYLTGRELKKEYSETTRDYQEVQMVSKCDPGRQPYEEEEGKSHKPLVSKPISSETKYLHSKLSNISHRKEYESEEVQSHYKERSGDFRRLDNEQQEGFFNQKQNSKKSEAYDQYQSPKVRNKYHDMESSHERFSAIDTYLKLHDRNRGEDLEPNNDMKDIVHSSRENVHGNLRSPSKHTKLDLNHMKSEKENISNKEAENFIKTELCSSLLSIKNRECPTTESQRYSKQFGDDLKKLTKVTSEIGENFSLSIVI